MDDMELSTYFKDTYLSKRDNLKIINVGYSKNDYSSIFNEANWEYAILDSCNDLDEVNIFVRDINYWVEVPDVSCDVVFSEDFFVNLEYFWLVMFQIERILKPNGCLCIIVPDAHSSIASSNLNVFTSESLKSLAESVNLEVCEIFEKNSKTCLIAKKKNIAQQIFLDSIETNAFKNSCDIASEKLDIKLENLSRINHDLNILISKVLFALSTGKGFNDLYKFKTNLEGIKNFNLDLMQCVSEIRYDIFEFNSSKHVFCPICQSVHNIFSPFGNPSRFNAQCPSCNSLEKHRLIYLFLEDSSRLLSNDIKLLHFEPDSSLYDYFKSLDNVEYISAGNNLSFTVDNVIDFENIEFPENNFDMIILDYATLNDYEDYSCILENLYNCVKDKEGVILIHFPLSNYESNEELDGFENQLENSGFKVTRYAAEDIVDQDLMEIYGLISDIILICEKELEDI